MRLIKQTIYAETAAVSGNYLRFFESIFAWAMPSGLEITLPVITNDIVSAKTVTLAEISKAADLNAEGYSLTFHTEVDENGNYNLAIYEYEIIDIFGRVYTSDMAIIHSQNGEITIEKLGE